MDAKDKINLDALNDVETIDEMLVTNDLCAILSGFKNTNEMHHFKYNACEGLLKFGGSFAQALGQALFYADMVNTAKILRYWRQDCEKHAALYMKFLEKQKGNS